MRRSFLITISVLFSIYITGQSNDCACCAVEYSQFDFWIGTWEVTNPDGSKAGKNIITKGQDNCVLTENWKSTTPGYTGTSNNFYNPKTKEWEQLWIDNKGASLHLKGNKIGNKMVLRTENEVNPKGESYFHRVTWTANKDGTVRQLWETITSGKNISVAFDGLYKRLNSN